MKKVLLVFAMVLLVPFFSRAVVYGEGSIFEGVYNVAPAQEIFRVVTCYGEVVLASACEGIHLSKLQAQWDITNTSTVRRSVETNSWVVNGNTLTVSVRTKLETWNPNTVPPRWFVTSYVNMDYNASVVDTLSDYCEGEDYPVLIAQQYAGQAEENRCYSPVDLAANDTCPNSTSDDDYVTPALNLTKASICFLKPDGSMCKSDYVGGIPPIYVANFENTGCYGTRSDLQDSDDNTMGEDPEKECQKIGQSSVVACLESPENVCKLNTVTGLIECKTSCGSFNGQFMCLTGDTDNDDLGDYYDPDIDGDGIPNGADTDADGDGKIDRDYGDGAGSNALIVSGGNGSGTVNVTVDTTELETLTRGTQSILNAGLGTLNQTAAQIRDKLDPVTDGTDENTASAAAFAKSADTLGGKTLTDSDGSFFNGITSKITVSGCSNPNFKGHDIFNMCDIAPKVATFMEWVLWGSLLWFLWEEFHSVFRRQS